MVSIKTFLIIAVASGLILVASPQNRVVAENPVPEIHLLIDLDHDTGLKRIGPGYGVSRLDDEGTACTQEESLAAA